MAALLALLAAVSWGSSDFLAGNASRRSSAVSVVILTHLASVVALLLIAVDFGPVWTSLSDLASGGGDDGVRWAAPRIVGAPNATDLGWGLAAGLGGGLGAMLLFRGLGLGSMAVVAPVTAAGAAIIPVIAGLATGDPLSNLAIVGIVLALVSIVLVSLVAGEPVDDPVEADEPADADDPVDPQTRLHGSTPAPPHAGAAAVDGENGSLTIPPGWVEEFRREHGLESTPNGGSASERLPAPVAGSAVIAMPPPAVSARTSPTPTSLLAPTAPPVPTLSAPAPAPTAPLAPMAPVAVDSPTTVAQVVERAAHESHAARSIRGLLRLVAALLLALVAAAIWLAVGTIAELGAGITAAQIGVLALSGLMVAVSLIAIWATAPLFRTTGIADASAAVAKPGAVGSVSTGGTSRPSRRRLLAQPGLPEALLSGVGFGLFFVFIYRTSETAGQWPLIGARSVSVVMFAVAAVISSTAVMPAAGSRLAVVGAGLFDAIAAVLFVVATRAGLLSVAAVLASLYPAVTVLLARVVTKETIRPIQIAGLALALGAVGLLAL